MSLPEIQELVSSLPWWSTPAALLAGLALGVVLGRRGRHVFLNLGEARLAKAVMKRFVAPDYHLLNHVTLRLAQETTQIDHVLVSRFGIFVIEAKDHRGWIFANSRDRQWTQVLYRSKFRFQNPIRQNYKHVRAVQDLLDFVPADAVRSVVVFTGQAEFKTPVPEGVYTLPGLIHCIESHTVEVLSVNRVQLCVGRLEMARLSISRLTDVEHVQQLRRRYGWT